MWYWLVILYLLAHEWLIWLLSMHSYAQRGNEENALNTEKLGVQRVIFPCATIC
ncbi:hypothetical protein [uncultured Gammaproteobacteria bacterium]|nr:hypothetical protein [uncultured Gammaproteobacteria bacterium]